jgi:8-oxo-dGTP diphosphatase
VAQVLGEASRRSETRLSLVGDRRPDLPKVYSSGMGKDRASSEMDFGIRVGAVLARDGALLLVRHQKPDRDPYWVLPGGRLEPGETVPECARREIREETGLSAQFSGVLYLSEFLREGRHTVDVTVRMTPEGDEDAVLGSDPEVAPGSEPTLRELRWVGTDELEQLELLPAWIRDRLIEDASAGWSPGGIYLGGSAD